MFTVDNKLIETLICSTCEKYLSVSPVKVYRDGTTKCGRCNTPDDRGIPILRDLLKDGLFPCIHHYAGCKIILTSDSIIKHELTCSFKNVKKMCIQCKKVMDTVFEYIQHFKNYHAQFILKQHCIRLSLNEDFSHYYLYLNKNGVFEISVSYIKQRRTINFLCLKLNLDTTCNVNYQFNLTNIGYVTKIQTCKYFKDINSITSEKINLSKIEQASKKVETLSCVLKLLVTPSRSKVSKRITLRNQSIQTEECLTEINQKTMFKLSEVQTDPMEEVLGVTLTGNFRNESPFRSKVSKRLTLRNQSIQTEIQTEQSLTEISQKTTFKLTEVQTDRMEEVLGVILTEKFTNEFPNLRLTPCGRALIDLNNPTGKRINLNCFKCKHFTGVNIFSCKNNLHVYCWDCKRYCQFCNTSEISWNEEASSKIEMLQFPCRWSCKQHFIGGKLRTHEEKCRSSVSRIRIDTTFRRIV